MIQNIFSNSNNIIYIYFLIKMIIKDCIIVTWSYFLGNYKIHKWNKLDCLKWLDKSTYKSLLCVDIYGIERN